MRLLINHLTRMHGGRICVAGVDLDTRRHVRPLPADGQFPFYLLTRYGGPFEMAHVVDLGSPRPTPDAPHVEDHVFVPRRARSERPAAAQEFWGILDDLRRPTLREIFGGALVQIAPGRWVTAPGQGTASLGLLRPASPPRLVMLAGRDSRPRLRLHFTDGSAEAEAGVSDLRLYGDDHAAIDAGRVRAVAQWLADGQEAILGLGLTRKYRPSRDAPFHHWLQVTNIHFKQDPTWAVG